MGSVVLSEVAYHAPWPTMLASNSHQSESLAGDPSYRANSSSRAASSTAADRDRSSSSSSTASAHHHATATTPADSARLTQTPSSRQSSHTPQPPASAQAAEAHITAAAMPSSSAHIQPSRSPTLPSSHKDESDSGHDPSLEHRQPAAPSTDSSSSAHPSPSLSYSPGGSGAGSPPRIKVKDLSQIQTLINEDSGSFGMSRSGSEHSSPSPAGQAPQYEISGMPVSEIIEMVAGVLTKITTSNDHQHEHLHPHLPPGEGAVSQQTASVISFHGKNKPNISILSYLSRIHKYCPTTYEVFVSLLVYFDRMTNRVNTAPMQRLQQANQRSIEQMSLDPTSEAASPSSPNAGLSPPPTPQQFLDPRKLSQLFVVDSFNIHRLVIAGVTCASKFFSDVFYTNSRYAKVGGLPQAELNHLELQFLLLNDFRLCIPVEELEAYGTMLVEFYAREVIGQRRHDEMEGVDPSN